MRFLVTKAGTPACTTNEIWSARMPKLLCSFSRARVAASVSLESMRHSGKVLPDLRSKF